ncbi:unnamed protein product [Ilex paraguariensis]|uniref:Uncharacterized protein n=1 Tax=Ilex paraguariensis TaxID=185542 RepID=A0ABC8RYK1_9AQUA
MLQSLLLNGTAPFWQRLQHLVKTQNDVVEFVLISARYDVVFQLLPPEREGVLILMTLSNKMALATASPFLTSLCSAIVHTPHRNVVTMNDGDNPN